MTAMGTVAHGPIPNRERTRRIVAPGLVGLMSIVGLLWAVMMFRWVVSLWI